MALIDKMPYALRVRSYRPIITEVFSAEGLHPAWGLAFARQESNFKSDACALSGGDGRRGGSFGLFQVSYRTAQGLNFYGNAEELFEPRLNAELASKLIFQLLRRFGEFNLKDIAAAYNSGKPLSEAPLITRSVYVPNVLAYADEFGWKWNVK